MNRIIQIFCKSVLVVMLGFSFLVTEIKAQEDWMDFTEIMNENPRFTSELQDVEKLRMKMFQKEFDYEKFVEAREKYVEKIVELVESNKNDSLKLAVMTDLIAGSGFVNAETKNTLFNQLNTETFSAELIEDYKSYLEGPKYQPGDKLEVENIFSHEAKSEIPLTLTSEVTIILFWSSWCPSCHRYYPTLEKLLDKYDESQFSIIGISLDHKKKNMKKYEKKHGLRFTSYSDLNKEMKSSNAERFGVLSLPTCLVVDKNKNILFVTPEEYFLEPWIDGFLNRK